MDRVKQSMPQNKNKTKKGDRMFDQASVQNEITMDDNTHGTPMGNLTIN